MTQAIPTLISLGAGPQQVPLIEAALAADLAVVTVDRAADAPGHALATHGLVVSTHEPLAILSQLRELESELDPGLDLRGVVCRSTGRALETQAKLAAALGVRGLTPDAVRIATSKSELRRFCQDRHIAMPEGVRVAEGDRVTLGLPLVVKPDYTVVGKKDVRRVSSSRALPEAISEAACSSFNGMAEVESFIDGVDVACVFWVDQGRAHVLALYDEVLGFAADGTVVPLGVSAPTLVDARSRRRVLDLADRFADALVGTSALLILCVRVDFNGVPQVIELHADLGGDRIAEELLPASIPGFDYFRTVVSLATGGAPPEMLEQSPALLLYRGDAAGGGSQQGATRVLCPGSRAELLLELRKEVKRRGSSLAVAPPVLRLAAAI